MSLKKLEEIHGYEYDWLACDRFGHVALLSTAGGGYAPRAFLADTERYDMAIEELLKLSPTTFAKTAPQVAEGLPNTWKEAATRGLYAFDSDTFGRPYHIVGVPETALLVEQLPPEVAAVVKLVRLNSVRFCLVEEISQEDIAENETVL